jgi:uncharacterized protein YkwD
MCTASQKLRLTTLALSSMVSCAAATLVASSAAAQATSPIVNQVAGETDSWQHFTVDIAEGTSALNVVLSGGTGDFDLYVRMGEQPTSSLWDCRPYKDGVEETCSFTPPRAGTYHIGIHAYTAFSGATLTTSWTAPTAPTAPSTPATLADWKQKVLDRHNILRAPHCAAPLAWDEAVAASAQAWADQCKQEHPRGTGLGENLAGASGEDGIETRVDSWYSEVEAYDFAKPGFSLATSHFTQVVWRGSTKLGCGVTQCPASAFPWSKGSTEPVTWLVCRYAEAGNMEGAFPANVRPVPGDGVCR